MSSFVKFNVCKYRLSHYRPNIIGQKQLGIDQRKLNNFVST